MVWGIRWQRLGVRSRNKGDTGNGKEREEEEAEGSRERSELKRSHPPSSSCAGFLFPEQNSPD